MKSCNLALAVAAIACEIADGRTENEVNLLSAVFSQLGDTLETIAAQRATCGSSENSGEAF